MQYKIKHQTFNRLPLDSAAYRTHGTGSTGSTGSTGTYMSVIGSRKITSVGSTGPLTAGELKSQLAAKYPSVSPLYAQVIMVNGTGVADNEILDPANHVTFNQVFTPALKKYGRRTLPAPIPRPSQAGNTGETGATGSSEGTETQGATGATGA